MSGPQTKTGVDEIAEVLDTLLGNIDNPNFTEVFDRAESEGVNISEIENIYEAMNLVTEAVAVAFIDDVTGGELEFDYEPVVSVRREYEPGSKGQGKRYIYQVNESVPGLEGFGLVDIEMSIDFFFPTEAPSFSFTPDSTEISIKDMQANVTKIQAVSDDVTLMVEANSPVVTLALGGELQHDDDGYITMMTLWPDGDVLQSNVRQIITQGDAEIALETVGTISELSGNLYFSEEDVESSQVIYNAENLRVRATLDGVSPDEIVVP